MKYIALLLSLFLVSCGGNEPKEAPSGQAGDSGLSAEQLEHGIGPIAAFDPGPIDPVLAQAGSETFTTKCSACHKMDERYVGPALGDVTTRRSPAYVMNMILNPDEMIQKHPEARALLAQFMTPMANQNLTQDEARSVLEYLRQQAASH